MANTDLTGKVANQAGDPKVGLTVELWESSAWETPGARTAVTTTDSEGNWTFASQDATKTWLVVVIDGTKKFLLDGQNKWQVTDIDVISDVFVDTITEHTATSGVTIEGVLLKDSYVDFAEATLPAGTRVYVGRDNSGDLTLNALTGQVINLAIDGTDEVRLSATNFQPVTNDGNALGVSGTAWADLFLASGAVINFNAGNLTLTHSAGLLTLNGEINLGAASPIGGVGFSMSRSADTAVTGLSLANPNTGASASLLTGYALTDAGGNTVASVMVVDKTSNTDGVMDTRFAWTTVDDGTQNIAMRLDAPGTLSLDIAGGGTPAQVDLFDEYDDALELHRFAHSVAGITPEQRDANRARMVELGIFERKDTGSGYFMNIQPLTRLLAGGIYQTRALMDSYFTDHDARILKLEAENKRLKELIHA